MQNDVYRYDFLSLAQIGMATLVTELVVAQKFAQALQMQSSLVMGSIRAPSYLEPVPSNVSTTSATPCQTALRSASYGPRGRLSYPTGGTRHTPSVRRIRPS
jgi:hypothetical protein